MNRGRWIQIEQHLKLTRYKQTTGLQVFSALVEVQMLPLFQSHLLIFQNVLNKPVPEKVLIRSTVVASLVNIIYACGTVRLVWQN